MLRWIALIARYVFDVPGIRSLSLVSNERGCTLLQLVFVLRVKGKTSLFLKNIVRSIFEGPPTSNSISAEGEVEPVLRVEPRPALGVHDSFPSPRTLACSRVPDKLGFEPGEEHGICGVSYQGGSLIVDLELVTVVSGGQDPGSS